MQTHMNAHLDGEEATHEPHEWHGRQLIDEEREEQEGDRECRSYGKSLRPPPPASQVPGALYNERPVAQRACVGVNGTRADGHVRRCSTFRDTFTRIVESSRTASAAQSSQRTR